jgi:hypothetical protein
MKKQQEDYAAALQQDHDRWEEIYTRGGSDPFSSDGVNLWLVRNHIMNDRRKIEETMQPDDYPDIYFKEIPPEVDKGYMARADEIRAAAKQSLSVYKADSAYQYIRRHRNDFSSKTQKKLYSDNVLNYVTGLECAIAEDDLITMRRHERPDSYLKSFEECVCKMRAMPPEDVQVTMFGLASGSDDTPGNEGFDEDMDTDESAGMKLE